MLVQHTREEETVYKEKWENQTVASEVIEVDTGVKQSKGESLEKRLKKPVL